MREGLAHCPAETHFILSKSTEVNGYTLDPYNSAEDSTESLRNMLYSMYI